MGESKNLQDVVILGSGPAGLRAAIDAERFLDDLPIETPDRTAVTRDAYVNVATGNAGARCFVLNLTMMLFLNLQLGRDLLDLDSLVTA